MLEQFDQPSMQSLRVASGEKTQVISAEKSIFVNLFEDRKITFGQGKARAPFRDLVCFALTIATHGALTLCVTPLFVKLARRWIYKRRPRISAGLFVEHRMEKFSKFF